MRTANRQPICPDDDGVACYLIDSGCAYQIPLVDTNKARSSLLCNLIQFGVEHDTPRIGHAGDLTPV